MNTPASPALLEVSDLSIGFPGQRAIDGIGFSIQRGETLALVGESGSGKSLTAYAILRLLPGRASISGGSIRFDGEDLLQASERRLRRIRGKEIALILQEPMTSLNPVLPIGEQIAEPLRQHESLSRRQVRERVIELLDLVGISEPHRRCQEYPHNFSGGMRQRVMIAAAVACHPRLLIADEPTTALDVTIQAQIMDLLDKLRKELSMAMLLITHDLGAVAQWADRVAVMYAGRLVEQSAVQPFFSQPLHPYSLGLLGASVGEHADWHYRTRRLTEITGTVASAAGEPGCNFAPRCPRQTAACRIAVPAMRVPAKGRLVACTHITA